MGGKKIESEESGSSREEKGRERGGGFLVEPVRMGDGQGSWGGRRMRKERGCQLQGQSYPAAGKVDSHLRRQISEVWHLV